MPIHPPGRTLSESFDQDLKAIRMADRLGFSTLLLHDQDWGRDNRQFHSSMKLLATEVMPVVKDLKP